MFSSRYSKWLLYQNLFLIWSVKVDVVLVYLKCALVVVLTLHLWVINNSFASFLSYGNTKWRTCEIYMTPLDALASNMYIYACT